MPFHCDNRALASTTKQDLHCSVERSWGEQLPEELYSKNILELSTKEILAIQPTSKSKFRNIIVNNEVSSLRNRNDEWKEAVYICRASFANSFALIPETVAQVDDRNTIIKYDDLMSERICGETRFWNISKAIMKDSINDIASFWVNSWNEYVH